MANPGAIYTDGDFTVPNPVTLPVLSAPIQGVNVDYILTQEFVQLEANFTSLPLNTAYPNSAGSSPGADFAGDDSYNSAGFILVGEGPRQDIGAGVVRWTRRYARIPSTHYDPVQVSYQFPGFLEFLPLETLVRNPFTRSVPGTVEYAYFLAGTNTQAAIQAVETTNYVAAQQYVWPRTFSPPLPSSSLQVDYLWDLTTPTLATYASWVSSGTITIVPYASQFTRWEGNILRREVITILPQ